METESEDRLAEIWAICQEEEYPGVCSKCGSRYATECHDPGTEGDRFSGHPGYHKNQPGVKLIPYWEWRGWKGLGKWSGI